MTRIGYYSSSIAPFYLFTNQTSSRLEFSRVAQTIVRLLRPFRRHVHTITFDHGTEFGRHQHISRSLGVDIYFAQPYCSWQRGSNENTNGLLRQYFPKKTNFNHITDKSLDRAATKINHKPRKRHGYKSPVELFRQLKK